MILVVLNQQLPDLYQKQPELHFAIQAQMIPGVHKQLDQLNHQQPSFNVIQVKSIQGNLKTLFLWRTVQLRNPFLKTNFSFFEN